MRREIPNEFKNIAALMQSWERGKGTIGYDEVLVWWRRGGIGVALRGDALRIEKRFFETQMVKNSDHYFDLDMQKAFGFNVYPEYSRQGHGRIIGVSGGAGQLLPTPDAHYSEVIGGIETCIRVYLENQNIEEIDVHVTLMPNEGSPWEPSDTPTPYYNAKTKEIHFAPLPEWMVGVDVRSERGGEAVKAPGVDFCKIMPILKSDPDGCFIIRDNAKKIYFMATHAFDFSRRGVGWREVSKFVNRCGGLLFPSIAIGQMPAMAIGTIVFVIDPMVVLQGMKPYKTGRGRWPIVTYTTDVWTEITSGFLGEIAAEAFAQLTGQWELSSYGVPHFYILGPRISRMTEEIGATIVLDTKKLSNTMSRRARTWHRDLDIAEVVGLQDVLTVDRYPYLEAKANGIVGIESLVACVVPSSLVNQARAFLRSINFQGEVISIPVTKAEAKALEEGTMYVTLFDYSWRVHDAIVNVAQETGRIEVLRF